jgi:hypothetical protein
MDKEGYIYVLYNPIYKSYGDNVYKIGRAADIQTRLKSFTTSYIEPSIVKYSLFSKYFIELEKNIHRELNQYRINPKREYFNCDFDFIVKTIEEENEELIYKNECNIIFIDEEIDYLMSLGCEPLDLSLERFNKIVAKNYTINTLLEYRIFPDLLKEFYSNEKGKVCVLLDNEDNMELKAIDKKYNVIIIDAEYIIKNYFKKSDVLKAKNNLFLILALYNDLKQIML